jgi:hypothetical protein
MYAINNMSYDIRYNRYLNVALTYIYLLKYKWIIACQHNNHDWINLTMIGNSQSVTTYFMRTNE